MAMGAAVRHGWRKTRVEAFHDPPPPNRHEIEFGFSWCGIRGTDLEE